MSRRVARHSRRRAHRGKRCCGFGYAVDDAPQPGFAEGERQHRSPIEHHALTLRLSKGTFVQFRLDGDGHMRSTYAMRDGWRTHLLLQRILGIAPEIIVAFVLPIRPISQDIRIDDEGGQLAHFDFMVGVPRRSPLLCCRRWRRTLDPWPTLHAAGFASQVLGATTEPPASARLEVMARVWGGPAFANARRFLG